MVTVGGGCSGRRRYENKPKTSKEGLNIQGNSPRRSNGRLGDLSWREQPEKGSNLGVMRLLTQLLDRRKRRECRDNTGRYRRSFHGDGSHSVEKIDINGLDIRLLSFFLGHSNREHSVFHGCFHLIHLRILWQPKPSGEFSAAALDAMPCIVFIFFLYISLATDS
ncbi:hypothetical protein LXL04_003951 [Taraxacum kok-saghyz]